jgi:transposase InsO family protein
MMASREEQRLVIGALQRYRDEHDEVPNGLVRAAAEALELTPRHVRRLIIEGIGPGRTTFKPTAAHIDVLYSANGNVAKTAELCQKQGLPLPVGERQLRRCFGTIDQALVAGARQGWAGLVSSRGYSAKYVPHRAHTYCSDSSPMNLLVLDKPGGRPIDLFETHVLDEFSRLALVVATTDGFPDTNVIVAVLGAAVAGYETDDGSFIGGIPDRVLSDNGAEYKSKAVTAGLVRVGFTRKLTEAEERASGLDELPEELDAGIKKSYTNPESGFENGISESFHITFQEGFCGGLPGFVNPRWPVWQRLKQRAYWKDHPELLLTREQADMLLQRWVMDYNFKRKHSGIGGRTPYDAWQADDHPLRRPDPAAVALAMMNDITAVVDRGRIKALSSQYYAPELGEFQGRTVEVRYLPGRLHSVKIFINGHYVCDAVRRDHLTNKDSARIKEKRRKQTEAHLSHSAAGERLKAERTRRELIEKGYAEEDLPALPEPAPIEKAVEERDKREAQKRRGKAPTEDERAALEALLATHSLDEEDIA